MYSENKTEFSTTVLLWTKQKDCILLWISKMAPVYQFYCVWEIEDSKGNINWDTLYSVTENSILSAHYPFVWTCLKTACLSNYVSLLYVTLFCPSPFKPKKDNKIYIADAILHPPLRSRSWTRQLNSNSLIYINFFSIFTQTTLSISLMDKFRNIFLSVFKVKKCCHFSIPSLFQLNI